MTDEQVQELLESRKILKNGEEPTGLIGEAGDILGTFPHKGTWYFGWLPQSFTLQEIRKEC